MHVVNYIVELRDKLENVHDVTLRETPIARNKAKKYYDRQASSREFEVRQSVLIYIPAEDEPLKSKFHGPYEILQKLSPVNYLINTPDRRKKTLIYRINFIRPFHKRDNRFDNDVVPTALFMTDINSPDAEIMNHDDLVSAISHYQLPDIDIELRGNPSDDFSPK